MIPPILVKVSVIPTVAALFPSGAVLQESHAELPPAQHKMLVVIKKQAKYLTPTGTISVGASKIVYPAIPNGVVGTVARNFF